MIMMTMGQRAKGGQWMESPYSMLARAAKTRVNIVTGGFEVLVGLEFGYFHIIIIGI